MQLHEPMPEMFTRSRLLVLDFSKIPDDVSPTEDIAAFFEECRGKEINPVLPENRQDFNARMLAATGARYLVSQYGEDRTSMLAGTHLVEQGRVIHLGMDIFSADQEPVLAPADGEVVRAAYEEEEHGYGNYVIFAPNELNMFIFMGHLAMDHVQPGRYSAGQQLGRLGDYVDNENGGWSRHMHLQLATELLPKGQTPPGYSTPANFTNSQLLYPNPLTVFNDWHIT